MNIELNWLLELNARRAFESSPARVELLDRLVKGKNGEQEVHEWLLVYGKENWHIWADVWIDVNGKSQIDFLVYANGIVWVVEVKNYGGQFEYHNNQCYLFGHKIQTNVMVRMEERMNRVRRIMQTFKYDQPEVRGVMVFIGEHCRVQVDQDFSFEIVVRNQFKEFLERIGKEWTASERVVPAETVWEAVNRYRVAPGFPFEPITKIEQSHLKLGVHCAKCGSFEVEDRYKWVLCNGCQFRENKRRALVRTACELGLVYFQNPKVITKGNLIRFSNGFFKEYYIRRHLSKLLKVAGASKSSYYLKPNSTIEDYLQEIDGII